MSSKIHPKSHRGGRLFFNNSSFYSENSHPSSANPGPKGLWNCLNVSSFFSPTLIRQSSKIKASKAKSSRRQKKTILTTTNSYAEALLHKQYVYILKTASLAFFAEQKRARSKNIRPRLTKERSDNKIKGCFNNY